MRPSLTPLALVAGLTLSGAAPLSPRLAAQDAAPQDVAAGRDRAAAPDAASAPVFADELPGYYAFYKRAGDTVRLDDEVARDVEMTQGDRWSPVVVDEPLPPWTLPNGLGTKVPLRSGNAGRLTVITTFQAWW